MPTSDKKKTSYLENRKKMLERHKLVQDFDEDEELDSGYEPSTISLESLQEQLQTLKHEINIETIQTKLRAHELFFKELGEDKETLLEIIRLFKQKKEAKQKRNS